MSVFTTAPPTAPPPGLDLIVAFHACLFVGVVPVIIRPPSAQNVSSALPTIKLTLEMSQARAVLTTSLVARLLKSKVGWGGGGAGGGEGCERED